MKNLRKAYENARLFAEWGVCNQCKDWPLEGNRADPRQTPMESLIGKIRKTKKFIGETKKILGTNQEILVNTMKLLGSTRK